MRVVYIDTVFVVNFLIDYILLYLTSKFLMIKTSIPRTLLSSILGAIVAVILALLVTNQFLALSFSFVSLYIMSLIAFGKINSKIRARQIAVMYIFSYILCGVVSFITPLFDGLSVKYKAVIIVVSSAVFLFMAKIIIPFFRNKLICSNIETIIEFEDGGFELNLLVDSGNLLVDNVSGLPVILVNQKEKVDNTYPICFKTVDKDNMAWGKVPQKILVKHEDTYKEIRCCVAFVPYNSNFSGYDGIIPQSVLQNL